MVASTVLNFFSMLYYFHMCIINTVAVRSISDLYYSKIVFVCNVLILLKHYHVTNASQASSKFKLCALLLHQYLNCSFYSRLSLQGLYSLSGKTSYRKISWSLEAARFGFKLFQSLWNLAGTSAALLPRCLSNFRAIQTLQDPISRLRDFTRFGGKTSYCLVNRVPVS